ncbi:MAG: hypothetical protein RI972_1933, partial [Pseudomonadota bacterium]
LLRLVPRRLNRRAPAPLGAGTTLNPEDVWPRRLNSLLRPPVEPGHRGAWPAPT